MNDEALPVELQEMGRAARIAARRLAMLRRTEKDSALRAMCRWLAAARESILSANADDVAAAECAGASPAAIDRLRLDDRRFDHLLMSLTAIQQLADPVGEIVSERRRPNGLVIQRRRVPIGVIAVIYESRPNVTVDAAALCIKSGNAVILRGGSEAIQTNRIIHVCLASAIGDAGLPIEAVQFVPTVDRDAVGQFLGGLDGMVDLVIPRGGPQLMERVRRDARVPVLGHLQGNCHVYVDASADSVKAEAIVINSKLRRTGVCGAAETLLIDREAPEILRAP